jgi:hypothetical protein
LPNKTYSFQASLQSSGLIASNKVTAATMDTTSHDFSWETFTFGGEAGSSSLYDIAIIDENNIWAVGEIFLNDSLGHIDPTPYNAIHWDGVNWMITRIPTKTFSGTTVSSQIRTIFAFNENDIWTFSIAGSFSHWNGSTWETEFVSERVGSGNKLWGTSSSDLYLVCTNGGITHYNGTTWQKIESGIDVDLKDIYGTPDGKEIWACGWTNRNERTAIVKINDNSLESIWDSQTNRQFSYYYGGLALNTLWANGNSEFVLGTGNIIRHSLFDKKLIRNDWVPYLNGSALFSMGNYTYRIRGSSKNNIAAAGDCSMIWHYNGKSWHKYEELYNEEDRLYGLAVTDNLIVAVGKRYTGLASGALIHIGRR